MERRKICDWLRHVWNCDEQTDGCQMPDECDRKMETSVAPCNQTTEERRDDPRTCRGVYTHWASIHFVRVHRTVPKKKKLNPYIIEIRILKKVSNILQSIFKRKNQKVKMTNLQTNLHVGGEGDDEMIPFHCWSRNSSSSYEDTASERDQSNCRSIIKSAF